jgi:hypothetical protein
MNTLKQVPKNRIHHTILGFGWNGRIQTELAGAEKQLSNKKQE